MKTPVVERRVEQLTLNLDQPQFSICPQCDSKVIRLADGCDVCGWSENQKLLGDKSKKSLSIPCLIKQPHKEPFAGLIVRDRGSKFDVQVGARVVTLPKLYVFPHLPASRKCRTDRDISPSKKSRRKKGKGSGSIHYRVIEKKGKEYQQAYYHYEIWSQGDRLIKSSEYIPKKMESKIIRMNNQKVPVEKILKVLQNRSKGKR